MRLFQTMLAALVALLLGVAPAAAQTYPKFTGLVVDAANVLPEATKADLTAKLQALQRDTHRQLIVATIPDLQGYDLSEYGVGLGRNWGVGLRDVNNGAVLFIAPNEAKGHRGPRLEAGYGLEPVLTDAFAGQVIREQMMPRLAASGDIPGAMEAGVDAIIRQLRASPDEAKANTDAAVAAFNKTHQRSGARSGGGGIPLGLILVAFVIGFVVLSSLRRRGGGQRWSGGSGIAPVVLWGSGLGGWGGGGSSGGGSGWGGLGGGGGSSDSGGWGGSDFSGGGGGSFGGGGASGDW